jgi:hypothetical protein
MCQPRRLTTLWASMAGYRHSVTFYRSLYVGVYKSDHKFNDQPLHEFMLRFNRKKK